MSRTRHNTRHCKLGPTCGVCHPGKSKPPVRDQRKTQKGREER